MLSIKKQLEQYLKNLVTEEIPILLSRPEKSEHGDYASNVAFLLAKVEKKAPLIVAQELAKKIETSLPDYLEKVEAVAPGFLNFYIKSEVYLQNLNNTFDISGSLSGKKVMIEFTDPNPFKEFHIGHLYSNIVGESVSRLLEKTGAEVIRACYQGDVGLHVAKAIYGMQQKLIVEKLTIDALEQKSLHDRAKFLGESYALGSAAYDEDEHGKKEIIEINKEVFAKDPQIQELYRKGREWSLSYFEQIYQRLGTKFVKYYFESDVGQKGKQLVEDYLEKGVFEESEGAIIFPGENYGLHSRVFINSLGLPTYEAKELGLALQKKQDFPGLDTSIVITGNEINEYFRVLQKALEQIAPELAKKTKHLSHGMVRLPEGKMSSRTGSVITGEWLMDQAVEHAKSLGKDKAIAENVSEMIGIAAIKYALLKSSIGKDVEFNFEESISFEGNSGPYLQYTYVRTRSVLQKAGVETQKNDSVINTVQIEKEERELLKKISQFDEVVLEAAEKFSLNMLCMYLFELAQLFNLFYQQYPILKQNEHVTQFRICLTDAVGKTIHEGLNLLGIKTPESM